MLHGGLLPGASIQSRNTSVLYKSDPCFYKFKDISCYSVENVGPIHGELWKTYRNKLIAWL